MKIILFLQLIFAQAIRRGRSADDRFLVQETIIRFKTDADFNQKAIETFLTEKLVKSLQTNIQKRALKALKFKMSGLRKRYSTQPGRIAGINAEEKHAEMEITNFLPAVNVQNIEKLTRKTGKVEYNLSYSENQTVLSYMNLFGQLFAEKCFKEQKTNPEKQCEKWVKKDSIGSYLNLYINELKAGISKQDQKFLMTPEEFQEQILFTNLEAQVQFKLSMTGLQNCFPSNNFCGYENEINRIVTNYIKNFKNSKKFYVIEMNQAVNIDGFSDVYFDVFHPYMNIENHFAKMVQYASFDIFESLG